MDLPGFDSRKSLYKAVFRLSSTHLCSVKVEEGLDQVKYLERKKIVGGIYQ